MICFKTKENVRERFRGVVISPYRIIIDRLAKKQCAAVTIHLEEMSDPVQILYIPEPGTKLSTDSRETTYWSWFGGTFVPFIILRLLEHSAHAMYEDIAIVNNKAFCCISQTLALNSREKQFLQ